MEARLEKEETARLRRENAREQRRKEREAQEQSAKAATSMSVNYLLPALCLAHDFPVQKHNLKMQDRLLVFARLTILVTTRPKVNMAYPEVALAQLWVIGNFAAKFVIVKGLILYVSALYLSTLAHISMLG